MTFTPTKQLRYAAALLMTLIVAWLLCIPGSSLPSGPRIPHFDKWVHLGLFAALALLWIMALWKKPAPTMRTLVWVGIACSAYGLLLEWVQLHFATGRSFSLWDWFFDTAGAAAAVIFMYRYRRREMRQIADRQSQSL